MKIHIGHSHIGESHIGKNSVQAVNAIECHICSKTGLKFARKNLRRYQIENSRMYYVPQGGTLEIRAMFLGGPHWGPQNLEKSRNFQFSQWCREHGRTLEYCTFFFLSKKCGPEGPEI